MIVAFQALAAFSFDGSLSLTVSRPCSMRIPSDYLSASIEKLDRRRPNEKRLFLVALAPTAYKVLIGKSTPVRVTG
jgi:hypothetical protein